MGGWLGDLILVDPIMIELGTGTLQQTVHRGWGGLQHGRNLGCAEHEHLAQYQDGALARGKALQRGDERQPDAVTLRHFGEGILGGRGAEHGVRKRFQPRKLGPLPQLRCGVLCWATQAGGQGASPAVLQGA